MREQSPISDKPIFLDETGLRWRLVRIVLLSLLATVLILPIVLTISILTVEVLPAQSTDLQQQVHSVRSRLPDAAQTDEFSRPLR